MKKKGVAAQAFIYIMAVIVLALIVLVGYRAISGFLEKGEQVSFAAFKADMERAVSDIYGDFGSVTAYDSRNPLRVGGGFKELCFLNLDRSNQAQTSSLCDSAAPHYRPLLCSVWKDSPGWQPGAENVFLFPTKSGSGGISVFRISLDTNLDGLEDPTTDEGWLCVPVISGRINLLIAGKGDHAFISELKNE